MSPGSVATWPENGAPTLPNPACHSGNSSSHYSLPSVLPASQWAMSLTSSLACSLWVPGSDPEKLTLVKAQIIRKSQQSAGSVWLLGASQFILCWHVAGFGDDISLLSQMWWHTLPSSQDAKGKLKAAGATQWDSVFKESPSRWLEARYSCSGFCSMGSQSLRSTAIKGRHDQLISALGRSVWLLTDCCVLLRGR